MKRISTNTLNKVRDFLGATMYLASIVIVSWVSVWFMFLKPILYVWQCIGAGTLTAAIVCVTIVKILLSGFVGLAIMLVGFMIGCLIASK